MSVSPRDENLLSLEKIEDTAVNGSHNSAKVGLEELRDRITNPAILAVLLNDLACFEAVEGRADLAQGQLQRIVLETPDIEVARLNLSLIQADLPASEPSPADPPLRIAIVSFLFNWPSTGGGIVHTVELARFLAQAGYDVHHFFVRYDPWGIGVVSEPVGIRSLAITFSNETWNVREIQTAVRTAVSAFAPDYAIITDSWNFKPLLAEALSAFPYILRFQAMECFCPLNNVRLLFRNQTIQQCDRHQLASPDDCHRCLAENGHLSGSLHQEERRLSGVGTPEYDDTLRRIVRGAEAVLVVNPLQEAMISPFARRTLVVPSGMDSARFTTPKAGSARQPGEPVKILFAGLTDELMKGYFVLRSAGAILWEQRQDFEILITGDPTESPAPFERFIGWQSQQSLPGFFELADICVVPTIAQEALGRTAVEAMAAGRPVVASRIGGLPFTVADGATGLLAEPGDPADLSQKLNQLIDDRELRTRLGQAGRKRFEEKFAWDVIIEKFYRPLLSSRRTR